MIKFMFFTVFSQRDVDRFKGTYQPTHRADNCIDHLLFKEIIKNSIILKLTSNKQA